MSLPAAQGERPRSWLAFSEASLRSLRGFSEAGVSLAVCSAAECCRSILRLSFVGDQVERGSGKGPVLYFCSCAGKRIWA